MVLLMKEECLLGEGCVESGVFERVEIDFSCRKSQGVGTGEARGLIFF